MDSREAAATVMALPLYETSPSWGAATWVLIGGLTEVGFGVDASGNELILAVSWSGRGVFDSSGKLLARDDTPLSADCTWHDAQSLMSVGIGPLDGVRVPIAGLAGGGLALTTSDGWSLRRLVLEWPDEQVVLQPPGSAVLWAGHASGCVRLPGDLWEIRAAGFLPSGRVLLVATSADLLLLQR